MHNRTGFTIDPRIGLFLAGLIGLGLLFSLAAQSSAVPYNIRELFGAGPPLVAGMALAVAVLFAFGPPALLGILLMRLATRQLWSIPASLIIHAALTYFLLRIVVPLESIHDLVGTPVLDWNGELERLLRFVALFGGFSLLIAGGAALWVAERAYRFSIFRRWLLLAGLLLPVCYWVVVSAAATDNLVELLAVGGSGLYGLFLACWVLSLTIGGAAVAARVVGFLPSWSAVLVLLLLNLALGYMLVNLATSQDIIKYGQHFSALEFLLSPDRSQYVSGEALVYRYIFAHLLFQGLLAIAQYPAWLWLISQQPGRRAIPRRAAPVDHRDRQQGSRPGAGTKHARPARQAELDSTAPDRPAPKPNTGPIWLLFASAYLVFVVYGSLVPLDFRPMPIGEALERFGDITYRNLGIGSRADWVANILLFIPLTFLWSGLLWPRKTAHQAWVSLLILVIAIGLSLGIEFTQLFFPPRTVSQNDLVAESMGAVIGIALWWWKGPRLRDWVSSWQLMKRDTEIAEYLLWAYLAGLFIYNVLPLDLTISPVEIYHKWQSGKVNLIPFAFPVQGLAEWLYALLTDIVIWIPVSLLWVVSGRKNRMQAWSWTLAAALLLEVAQFFVFSRVSDITDLFTAALGAALGVWIASRFRSGSQLPTATSKTPPRQRWLLSATALWILVLAVIFWYPFDFRTDAPFLRSHFASFFNVPFRDYYYGTEYRAITELLHKLLFFAPLGVLLAIGRIGLQSGLTRTLHGFMSAGLIVLVPFLIEMGQVALPKKSPDVTDWVLEIIGGTIGFAVTLMINRRLSSGRGLTDQAY